MALGWEKTLAPDLEDVDWAHGSAGHFAPKSSLDIGDMDDVLTSSEVARAIKSCKRGKASGPDGLGNDWYRDHAERLTPILEQLFILWTEHSLFPRSFKEAFILGIKKKREALLPTDYRPITLLNADYKVYARIYASRLRGKTPALVHEMQNEFVPGRTIHTTLDAFYAIKALVQSGRLPASSLVLLLDFAKACDSLRRYYMHWVLRKYGFPPKFLGLVEQLHRGTTCRFLVNGYASRTINIATGIRQGCPLTPLLFILALDPLYRKIEGVSDLKGLPCQVGEQRRDLKVAGYADDTALYLNSPCKIPIALDILSSFGRLSGLRVNIAKSTGDFLTVQPQKPEASYSGIPFLQNESTCRYLGLRVGSSNTHEENWATCLQATAGRVALAIAKTHTAIQRVQIAKAVIVSKILFVARHEWPSRITVTQLHLMLKRFIWGWRGSTTKRAWVSETVSGLTLSEEGVAFPYILSELQAMSAKVVADRAASPHAAGAIYGDILLSGDGSTPTYITPEHMVTERALQYQPTPRKVGAAVLQTAHRRQPSDSLQSATTAAAPAMFASVNAARWGDEWLQVEVDKAGMALARRLIHVRRTELGKADALWMPFIDITVPGALWLDGRSQLRIKDWSFCGGVSRLGDLITWEWVASGSVKFAPVRRSYSLTNEHAIQFKRLCGALLVTYPHLLNCPQRDDRLTQYATGQVVASEWVLSGGDRGTILRHNDNVSTESDVITTMGECDNYAAKMEKQAQVTFHAHPHLSRLVQPWGGQKRWKASRKLYKRVARANKTQQGLAVCEGRADRWGEEDPVIGGALRDIDWADIHRLNPGSHMEIQTVYRLKAAGFSRWNGDGDSARCVHETCEVGAHATLSHWFWSCEAVQRVWRHFLAPWVRLHGGQWTDLKKQVFRFRLDRIPSPAVPSLLPTLATTPNRDAQVDVLLGVLQHAWTGTIVSALHGVWVWRIGCIFEPQISKQQCWVRLVTRTQARISALQYSFPYDTDPKLATVAQEVLCRFITQTADIALPMMVSPAPGDGRHDYVCFFDGGSRGNPGPGGAGSVIVRVHRTTRTAVILWCACMAYGGERATDNVAEYWGLIHGLGYALVHRLRPLHIVGDSTLILTQVETHRLPKAPHLQPLYLKARRLATQHLVATWRHHLREYNKMADAATNIAMENRASLQCDAPELQRDTEILQQYLTGDITHWLDKGGNISID